MQRLVCILKDKNPVLPGGIRPIHLHFQAGANTMWTTWPIRGKNRALSIICKQRRALIASGFLEGSPSSRPSPQGEGESFAASLKNLRLGWPDGLPINGDAQKRFLLPGEKVRMRAGQKN
jgi:hypothetical protein